MTTFTTREPTGEDEGRGGFTSGAWVRANAIGLGLAYALFGLLGDLADLFGAGHGFAHGAAATCGLLVGGVVFVVLRRRALAPYVATSTGAAVVAGIGLAVGFIVGVVIAGPPFDFILGAITLGAIGGGLQWRLLRHRVAGPGGLLLASIGGWVAAGAVVGAVAVFAGDAFFQLLGEPAGDSVAGLASFTAFLLVLGAVGGAVGGAIEGRALRTRIGSGPDVVHSTGAIAL